MYRYVLVIKANFSEYGWTIPIKNEHVQTIKDSFEKSFINSKRKTNVLENDSGKEFYNSIFQKFLKNFYIKHNSGNCNFRSCFCGEV